MYSPKEYWQRITERYNSVDSSGLAPVLHPNAPEWFNEIIDKLQFRAVLRALARAQVPIGARFLDVGCGTGRWIRRYEDLGFTPFGVDATFGMLRIAREHQTVAPLTAGQANSLPFASEVFDCVSDVTVVQHIPYELQTGALAELVRVLRPGGRILLLELVRGDDSHVFPRPPNDWISEVESCGARLVESFGVEYLFLDRLFVKCVQAASKRTNDFVVSVQSDTAKSDKKDNPLARVVYWGLRRMTVCLSALAEPIFAKICPASMATHAIFVFIKTSE